jgi:hypothetical protein
VACYAYAMAKRMLWTVMNKQASQSLSVSPEVMPWLERAGQPGGAHGSDLLHAIVPISSHPEQVVEDLLAWWAQIELVLPAKVSNPTESQRFLGQGGRLMGYDGRGAGPMMHPASWFDWARVGPIWLRGSG